MASILSHHLNFKREKDCGLRVSASLNNSGCLETIGMIETIFLSAATGFLLAVKRKRKFAHALRSRRLTLSHACSYKRTHGNDRSGR